MTNISINKLFQSAHLIYRAQSNSPEEKEFKRALMTTDSATYAYSTSRLLSPPRTEDVDADMSGPSNNNNTLLSVIIYLPLSDSDSNPNPSIEEEEEDDGTKEKEGDGKGEEEKKEKMIGCLSLESHLLTRHHRTANLGIIMSPCFQGKGFGTEAINWALDWAFGMAGMHAVRLTTFSYNLRAVRVYERVGFVREGVRRESLWFDGKWWDHYMYSMLEGEWAALRGRTVA